MAEQMIHSGYYLPTELVIDIFVTLPVKTLIRCTSVCKSWYVCGIAFKLLYYIQSLFTVVLNRKPSLNFVGLCNGLLCLAPGLEYNFGNGVYIWNPSIRTHKKLPPSRFSNEFTNGRRILVLFRANNGSAGPTLMLRKKSPHCFGYVVEVNLRLGGLHIGMQKMLDIYGCGCNILIYVEVEKPTLCGINERQVDFLEDQLCNKHLDMAEDVNPFPSNHKKSATLFLPSQSPLLLLHGRHEYFRSVV
ncbi:hypothetical protein L1987_19886 [Smallanthus sonchifolius]|uniref:Uncharacterized protein n=1 Tax=Smallanthus sonchifolius TaxID=185202 RepID=A0ACB9ISC7_9ASTR|nr:hypothetical protein L1987_19886 [Smallanthus sonchifolius]